MSEVACNAVVVVVVVEVVLVVVVVVVVKCDDVECVGEEMLCCV